MWPRSEVQTREADVRATLKPRLRHTNCPSFYIKANLILYHNLLRESRQKKGRQGERQQGSERHGEPRRDRRAGAQEVGPAQGRGDGVHPLSQAAAPGALTPGTRHGLSSVEFSTFHYFR